MWKPICVDEQEFVLKIGEGSRSIHQVSLTNFMNLWQEHITDEDLIQRCKKMNPLFEAKRDVLINHVLSLLDTENPDIVRHVEKTENQIVFHLQTKLYCIKFNFQFKLQLQPAEHMYKELTLPILLMITELQRQKKLLTSLLAKKDIEIAQYKLEGAELIRKNVQTEPFDEEALNIKSLESIVERRSDVELHPTHVFTISTSKLYQQVTSEPRKPDNETEMNAIVEPEMENTVQALLNEKKVSPKKRTKPKVVPVEPSIKIEVKTEIEVKNEVVPAKKRKPRVVLKNL